MNNKKIFSLTILLLLTFSLIALTQIQSVDALETVTSSNTGGVTLFYDMYNAPVNFAQGCGQTFTATTSGYLSSASFYIAKAGSPDFIFSARLVELEGGLDSNIDASSYLARSETKSSQGAYSGVTYIDFDNSYYINATESYGIILYVENKTSGDTSNKLQIGYRPDGNDGYMRTSDDGDMSWGTGSSNDFVFQVFVSDQGTPEATPSPTPSPTASPTPFTYQGDIWAALVPYGTLILPLILILIVALICGKYAGVWGFFAGLNISAILVYAIMGSAYLPLWGIVMLALVDGLLLFGKISGRM